MKRFGRTVLKYAPMWVVGFDDIYELNFSIY